MASTKRTVKGERLGMMARRIAVRMSRYLATVVVKC